MTTPAPIRARPTSPWEPPTLTERLLGGAAVGLSRDPIVGLAMEGLSKEFPSVSRIELESLARRLEGDPLAQVSELVGEYGPMILGGIGAYGLGRAAFTGVLKATAPRLAGRVAMATGGALGVGALGGAQATAAGEELPEVIRSAAVNAALSFGVEMGLLGLTTPTTKIPGLRGLPNFNPLVPIRPIPEAAAGVRIAGAQKGAAGFVGREARRLQKKIPGYVDDLNRLLDVENTHLDLANAWRAVGGLTPLSPGTVVIKAKGSQGGPIATAAQYLTGQSIVEPGLPEVFTVGSVPRKQMIRSLSARELRFGRIEQRIAKTQGQIAAVRNFGDYGLMPTTNIVYDDIVARADGTRETWERTLAYLAQRPEVTGAKLGVGGTQAADLAYRAEVRSILRGRLGETTVMRFAKDVAQLTGRKFTNNPRKMGEILGDIFEMYESPAGGLAGLERTYGVQVANRFRGLKSTLEHVHGENVRIGAQPFLGPATMEQLGVSEFLPHVIGDLTDKQVEQSLVPYLMKHGQSRPGKRGLSLHEATVVVNRILASHRRGGLQRFGSTDYQRMLPGTLGAKQSVGAKQGVGSPFLGPVEGLIRYLGGEGRRHEFGKVFGWNGDLRDSILSMIVAEGGSRPVAATMLDHLLQRNIYSHGLRQFAQNVTSLQSVAKLTYAALPNMGQPMNNVLFQGTRNTAKGMTRALWGSTPDEIARASGWHEAEFETLMRVFAGGTTGESWPVSLARRSMQATGFSTTERWNRLQATWTTLFDLEDTVGRGVAGRLRGTSWEAARYRMGRYGFDLRKVLDAARPRMQGGMTTREALIDTLGRDQLTEALFRGTAATQFTSSLTQTPPAWAHPVGRIATQFKRFALRQGTFLRDSVLGDARLGELRPLALFAGMYPIAGELIADAVAMGKGKDRDRNGVYRLMEDYMTLGGFGIVQAMASSAYFGRLEDFFLGPTFTDSMSFVEAATQGNLDTVMKMVSRQPAFIGGKRALEVGLGLTDYLLEPEALGAQSFEDFRRGARVDARQRGVVP